MKTTADFLARLRNLASCGITYSSEASELNRNINCGIKNRPKKRKTERIVSGKKALKANTV